MPTAADELLDIQIAHQIAVQRYGAGLSRKIVKLLNEVDGDLLAIIAGRLAAGRSTDRLEAILSELRVLNTTVYRKVADTVETDLQIFGQYEFEFQAAALTETVPLIFVAKVPPATMLRAIVLERPFSDGRTAALLKPWIDGMAAGRLSRIEGALRLGLVEGQTIDQMVRRIKGTKALNYSDGILDISRRSANTVVRTATNHVSTQAREETYAANDDIIKAVRWVSTLDGRTSGVCRARDGEIYEPGKGPRPPAHLGCRSTTTPVLKSWRELGLDFGEADEGTRASMDGQVPTGTTYGDFLKRKGAAFQDDVLGPTKARLFRDGGLTLDRFVDASGREYTIDELRAREAKAFKKAKL